MLRTAVALAAVMESDVKVTNIRAGREAPGMKAQHLAGVMAVAQMCDAELEGAEVGSTELRFRPQGLHGGSFTFDVGTAGSIALVLQAALAPAIYCGERVEMTVRGGTEVMNAPTIDYFGRVLLPILRNVGGNVTLEVVRRGFYPKGGGEVRVVVEPAGGIKPFAPSGAHPKPVVDGLVISSKLHPDIAERARRTLMRRMGHIKVRELRVVDVESESAGVSATVSCPRRGGAFGSSNVGRKGYTAEQLAEDCAMPLIHALKADVDVDEHLLDQVLLYCIIATGRSSFSFERMTPHAQTLLSVAGEFAPFNREVNQDGRRHRMVIDGEGV